MWLNTTFLLSGVSPQFLFANLSAGIYNYTVNVSETENYTGGSESWTINITSDKTPPIIIIYSPEETTYYTSNISINFTAIDIGSGIDLWKFDYLKYNLLSYY